MTKILVTWCEQLTHWKNPWSCRRLRVGREDGIRAWDGWTASLLQWTWTWANFGRWWGTGGPGMLQSMGHKVRHDWVTEQQQDNRSNMHTISKLLNIHHILDKGSFVSRYAQQKRGNRDCAFHNSFIQTDLTDHMCSYQPFWYLLGNKKNK